MDYDRFINDLGNRFPEILEEVQSPLVKGLIHSQVTVLKNYALILFEKSDLNQINNVFEFVDLCLTKGDYEVSNSIGVSFLEHLDFDKYGSYALNYKNIYTEWNLLYKHSRIKSQSNKKIDDFWKSIE